MSKSSTVIDCRKQCEKMEYECMESYKTPAQFEKERSRCERSCVFK